MPISTSFALGSNVWARAISKKRSDVDVFVVGIIKPVKASSFTYLPGPVLCVRLDIRPASAEAKEIAVMLIHG